MKLALFVLVAAGALAGAQYRGSVTSAGLPIPGAIVTATQGDRKVVTSTDENGVYTFPELDQGAWTVEVEAFGFAKTTRAVTLPAQTGTTWDLKLSVEAPPQVAARPAEAKPVAAAKLPETAKPAQAAQRAQGAQQPGGRAGFQRLGVNQTAQADTLAQLAAQTGPEMQQSSDLAQNANESFLVNGSLSRGLQSPQDELPFGPGMMMGGPGGPGMRPDGTNPPGFEGQGGMAGGPQVAGGSMGGPGMGRMGGSPMGGPGMGGMGGPMGGRGGFGGPGGRMGQDGARRPGQQRPDWQNREGAMVFGNRRQNQQSFRGMASFSLANSALDARPFSLTGQTVEKPSYAQSRFNLSGGGQLRIPKLINSSKTFIFANYSGTRSRSPYNSVSTLPSALERTGDFSQSVARGPVVIYDPLTQQPFPGNQIPASRINPAAAGLVSFFPIPNLPGQVQNYQIVSSVPQNTDNFGVRTFSSVTGKDRVGGGFNLQQRSSQSTQLFGYRDQVDGRGLSANAMWTHNFRPGLIGNLRWNFSRNTNNTLPYFANGANVASQLGIAGTSSNPLNYGPPNLSFTNFGGLTDASAALARNQTSSVNGGLTFVRGRQTISGGFEFRRSQINNRSDQNGRGTFVFTGLSTSGFDANGQPLAGTGFDLADFLLGLPQSSSIRFGSADTYFRGSAYNAYVQDDLRLRTNLTINFGLRYEYQTPLTEKYNRMANLDIAPGFTAVAPVLPGAAGPYTGVFPAGLVNPDRNNFAPRIGVAWRPFPRKHTLVRTGYGIYYNGSIYNQMASRLAQQPPFADSATFNTSLARILTLQDGFSGASTTQITNTYAVDRFYRIGYAQTWNFAVQQELPLSLVMEVGYLGTKGTRLDVQRLPNRSAPGSPLTAEQRRLIGNAVGFTFDSSDGNSIYHAAQLRLSRRFRRGISGNLMYTFGKSIDDVSTFGGGGAVVVQNDKDLRAERGLSSFDRRHTLSVGYVLSSPSTGSTDTITARRWYGKLMKNWTLSGNVSYQSGSPFTAQVLGNRSDSSGTGVVGSSRADATGLPVELAGVFFNPAAFTLPAAGFYGNAGRNTITGPASFVLNTALGRSFPLKENRRSLELRMEANNALNTMNVGSIGTTVNASNYGLALSAGQMRTMQATLRLRF